MAAQNTEGTLPHEEASPQHAPAAKGSPSPHRSFSLADPTQTYPPATPKRDKDPSPLIQNQPQGSYFTHGANYHLGYVPGMAH
eukprot:NODE_207_length_2161_cov_6.635890_g178_i0.p2 GENE.NODE_207_length_2161_cov_6.635890_g178_i0~~NODE_207_length_2161_cov_6.635890_g178_i0.p2  ORF type:complete len:93 (-),score=14.71 NODE_207_length_2161_cov_6.635890_g178_i0:1883-2131(-)